jgi:hypothetical protein
MWNAFIKKYPWWKNNIIASKSPACLLITTGHSLRIPQRQNTSITHL